MANNTPYSFTELLKLVSNGDKVAAGTLNRILQVLDTNTKYLKDLFDAAELASAVFARDVIVEPSANIGMPVYFNAAAGRYERAIARAEVDTTTGALKTSVTTNVWGIVHSKKNNAIADILLFGVSTLDLTASVGESAPEAGVYYLSSSEAGKLVNQEPPVSVAVLITDGEGTVFVNPKFGNILTDHVHYKFELQCVPAGDHTPPLVGERHEITNPDSSIEGWLPADHAVFGNKAPIGAAFGYNLSASNLSLVWPPLPVTSAYLEWDKGLDADVGFTGVPLGSDGLVVIDTNGIWWMSDCYGDVPWPATLDTTASEDSSSSSSYLECPRDLHMRLILWFNKMSFQTSNTVVTSLTISDDSDHILSLKCLGTDDDANTGDLELGIDLNLATTTETEPGHVVIKALEDNEFKAGPVVEAIVAGSSNVSLSSTAQTGSNHQGTVTISVAQTILGGELPIETVRMDGTELSYVEDITGIAFPRNKDTAYRAKVSVPAGISSSVDISLRFWLLAETAGTLPPLTLTARVVPRPNPTGVPVALPTTDSAVTLDFGSITTTIVSPGDGKYVEITSDAISADPGDAIWFTLSRNGSGDSYNDDVHVIDQRAVVS